MSYFLKHEVKNVSKDRPYVNKINTIKLSSRYGFLDPAILVQWQSMRMCVRVAERSEKTSNKNNNIKNNRGSEEPPSAGPTVARIIQGV